MAIHRLTFMMIGCFAVLTACGPKDGKDGSDSVPTRIHVETVATGNFQCPYNGKRIFVYKDKNGDGKLSPGEEITSERTLDCPTFDR